jgi:hypothetical protein
MANEKRIATGVMKIANSQHNLICTFKRAYAEIPNYVSLSAANLAPSVTRPGEAMWQQLVRNIKSHSKEDENFIRRGLLEHVPKVGYRITAKGQKFLNN